LKTKEIIKKLRSIGNEHNRKGMARFGINTENAFGVSVKNIRAIAKEAGKNRELAKELWETGCHEARIMASIIDMPEKVTKKQMNRWVKEFNSWDLCDQVITNLFSKTEYAKKMAVKWSGKKDEFTKRAGFVMMAVGAVHWKNEPDSTFIKMFPLIEQAVCDDRNMVKKGVNWAIRQIGKRNTTLNKKAISFSKRFIDDESKDARWVCRTALKELESDAVMKKLEENRYVNK